MIDELSQPRIVSDGMAVAVFEIDFAWQLLQSLGEHAHDVAARTSPPPLDDVRLVSLNEAALRLLGCSEKDCKALKPAALWSDTGKGCLADLILSSGWKNVGELSRRGHLRAMNGGLISGIISMLPARMIAGRMRIVVQFTDTRGLLFDTATAERASFEHSIFRNLPLGLCHVNGDALTSFYDSVGIDSGTNLDAFFRERPEVVRRAADLCIIEEANPEAARILGGSGANDLVGRSVAFAWRERPDSFAQTLVAGIRGRNHECETRLGRLDGETSEVILVSTVVRDDGRRASIIGMVDIGDRVTARTDLIRLQAQFAQSHRLALVGEMAAWFSHEISQPLAAIAATGSTGRRWLDRPEPRLEEARVSFDRIVAYADRSRGIIDRLRELANNHAPVLRPERLSTVIASALQLVEADAKAGGVTITVEVRTEHDVVLVDRAQMGQVVVNLVSNAIEVLNGVDRPGRELAIEIASGDGFVRCAIQDTGPGITLPGLDFGAGASTGDLAGRDGFGLAMSRSIIDLHRGRFEIGKDPGLPGACVSFCLPLAAAADG